MDSSASTSTMFDALAPTQEDLATVRSLLDDIRQGAAQLRDSVATWQNRLTSTSDLSYPKGISLLSLKNHLLLSYVHHLVALFSLKLSSTSLTSPQGSEIVSTLIKLRVTLEKINPLEGKLKYQIEKLVRKADEAARGVDEEDVVNDPLAFRPNIGNLVLDRTGSEGEDEGDYVGGPMDDEAPRSGIYRPPRVAAMPYVEGPPKGKKAKRVAPSHLVADLSTGLSASTPYGESTSGLSVSVDPTLTSGTARHLKQVEQYEMDNFTRMRMSKKDAKKRRAEEEEVAFGGLGAGRGGKRRLGGYGAEFDDLLGEIDRDRNRGAYDQMKKMKRSNAPGGPAAAHGERDESKGTSGLAGFNDGSSGKKGNNKKSQFDRAVGRAQVGVARAKRG